MSGQETVAEQLATAKQILGDGQFVLKKCKNEKDVKAEIRRFLKQYKGIWIFMPVQSGFGVSGTPDFVGAYDGHPFGIEAKFGSNKSSPMQKIQQTIMVDAGCLVWEVSERTFAAFADEWVTNFGKPKC